MPHIARHDSLADRPSRPAAHPLPSSLRPTSALLGLAVAALFSFSPAALSDSWTISAGHGDHGGRGEAETCRDVQMTSHDGDVERRDQNLVIPAASARRLEVSGSPNSPVSVRGWDRPEYMVEACVAAAGADASRLLQKITLVQKGESVFLDAPSREEEDWAVYLIVRIPRDGTLEVESTNGPISLRDTNGSVEARTQNGPVSLKNVAGRVDAKTQNGPLSLSGGSGDVRLNTQNGPITIRLSSDRWEGKGLEAHTANGPLALKLPETFESGVSVRASRRGPARCQVAGCRTLRRGDPYDDEDEKTFELGRTATVVRLSTRNGPVTVKAL